MTAVSTRSAEDAGPEWENFDLKKFVLSTIRSIEFGDAVSGVLEDRTARIEECVAARWPRRWLLWARLRREIRASVATWDPEYIPPGDFPGRRWEWAGQAASARYDRCAWKPEFGDAVRVAG